MYSNAIRLSVGALASAAGLTMIAAPAHADTGWTDFSCVYQTEGQETPPSGLPVSARFDSAIRDGAIAEVGDKVAVGPVTGKVRLSAPVLAKLRGLDGADLTLDLETDIPESGTGRNARMGLGTLDLSSTDQLTLQGKDNSVAPWKVTTTNRVTYYAVGFTLKISPNDNNPFGAALECKPSGRAPLIDSITVRTKAEPKPSTTQAPKPSATRPRVVQTDAAQPDTHATWVPLAAAGAASILVGAGVAGSRRISRRR